MRRRTGAEAVLVVATVIWGGTFAATRAGLSYVSPLLIIAIRFLVSFLILVPVYAGLRRNWWRHAGLGAVLGLALAGGYILQTIGLQYTSVARSGFLTYMFAVLIPPLQRLLTNHRINAANIIGLGIVIVGSTVMTQPWMASGWNLGDLVTLGAAVSFALFIVLVDRYGAGVPSVDLVPSQFLVAGLVALVGALTTEEMSLVWNTTSILAMSYLTLLGTVGALGLETIFQPRTTPVRATTIFALEPVFAAGFGFVILGERISLVETAGAAIILCGVLFSQLVRRNGQQRYID